MELNSVLKESNYRNNKALNQNQLNRVSAVVDEVGECSKTAKVRIMGNENLIIELPNKSNLPLAKNDNVWVYYWKDIGSGYIALNNTIGLNNILSSIEVGTAYVNIPENYSSALYIYDTQPCKISHSSSAKVFTEIKKSIINGGGSESIYNYYSIGNITESGNLKISIGHTSSMEWKNDKITIDYLIIG